MNNLKHKIKTGRYISILNLGATKEFTEHCIVNSLDDFLILEHFQDMFCLEYKWKNKLNNLVWEKIHSN